MQAHFVQVRNTLATPELAPCGLDGSPVATMVRTSVCNLFEICSTLAKSMHALSIRHRHLLPQMIIILSAERDVFPAEIPGLHAAFQSAGAAISEVAARLLAVLDGMLQPHHKPSDAAAVDDSPGSEVSCSTALAVSSPHAGSVAVMVPNKSAELACMPSQDLANLQQQDECGGGRGACTPRRKAYVQLDTINDDKEHKAGGGAIAQLARPARCWTCNIGRVLHYRACDKTDGQQRSGSHGQQQRGLGWHFDRGILTGAHFTTPSALCACHPRLSSAALDMR